METHVGDSPQNGSGSVTGTAGQTALHEQFKDLFEGVDDLIKRVADIESAEIQKIRAKVRVALTVAKSALQDGATQVRRQALQVANTTDDYVREHPWQSLGTATLVGFALGLLVSRRDEVFGRDP
jgi:ElaB/YqjD/DUF883 family membrane-anchored ribosome-binding protein